MSRNKPRLGFIDSMTRDGGKNYASMGQIIAEKFSKEGYPVIVSSCQKNKILRLLDIIQAIVVNRKKIDVLIVQVYSGWSFIITDVASFFGDLVHLPIIFHVHGGKIPVFMEKFPLWTNLVFKRADLVVAPSHYLISSLRRFNIHAVLVPNVIDLQHYTFQCRQSVSRKIVWLRAFHQIYNPTLGVKVIALLAQEFPDLNLTMIGPDKGDGSMQATIGLANKLGQSQRLHLPGRVAKQDVPKWLQKGDIFINTTSIDNTPVSVLEAMACGLCIVSTNVGGIPYLLEDGKDALLVPPDDPEAMASAVRRILTEAGLAEKLSINARKKAEQFDWSVVLPQWQKLLEPIMEPNV